VDGWIERKKGKALKIIVYLVLFLLFSVNDRPARKKKNRSTSPTVTTITTTRCIGRLTTNRKIASSRSRYIVLKIGRETMGKRNLALRRET
tara:strand:+ start:247 stop:519 length:273 start_codon:yes stop_codon:yes gene_type:complete